MSACEEALKETLRAPATYRRVKVVRDQKPLTLEEYLRGRNDPQPVIDLWRNLGKTGIRFIAFVEHDASNAAGVPLRSTALCSYDTLSADPSAASKYGVKINDRSVIDRLGR